MTPSRSASPHLTPMLSELNSDSLLHAAALQPEAHDDVKAEAINLPITLMSYNHHDWKQAQRDDPLCDMTLQAHLFVLETR